MAPISMARATVVARRRVSMLRMVVAPKRCERPMWLAYRPDAVPRETTGQRLEVERIARPGDGPRLRWTTARYLPAAEDTV
jgi:hypothetical protein